MASKQPLTFRRIRGRIVPIRAKDQKPVDVKEVGKASGQILIGTATAAGSGVAYRRATSQAVKQSARAWRTLNKLGDSATAQLSLFRGRQRAKAAEKANQLLGRMAKLGQAAAGLRLASVLGGASLIGSGVQRLTNELTGGKNDFSSAATGAVAAGAFITGAYKGAGLRRAIKPAYIRLAPKIREFKRRLNL
jgi:hypothetical protein